MLILTLIIMLILNLLFTWCIEHDIIEIRKGGLKRSVKILKKQKSPEEITSELYRNKRFSTTRFF